MQRNQKISAGGVIVLLVFINAIILERGLVSNPKWYRALLVTLPVLLTAMIFSRRRMSR